MFKPNNSILSILLSLLYFTSICSQLETVNLSKTHGLDNATTNSDRIDNSNEVLSDKEMADILKDLNAEFSSVTNEDVPDLDLMNLFQNPAAMAEKFPDKLRTKVLDAYQASNKTVAFILNPELSNNPVVLFSSLLNDLNSLIENNQLSEIIIQIHNYIYDESFNLKIQNNQSIGTELKKRFKENLDSLNSLFKVLKKGLDKISLTKLKTFRDILSFLSKGNLDKFFNCLANYKKNENLIAKKLLDSASRMLDELLKNSSNKEIIKAASFWKDTVFSEILPFIKAIDNDGNLDQTSLMLLQTGPIGQKLNDIFNFANKTAKFAPAILSSYGFYKQVLNYYLLDTGTSWKFFVSDSALTTFIFPIYFLKKIAELKNTKNGFNPASLVSLYNDLSSFYNNPDFLFQNSSLVARSSMRIGSSIAYYNLWYRKNIAQSGAYNEKVGKYVEDSRYWPVNFKYLNTAVWKSIQDGYLSVGQLLENKITEKIDPLLLNSIEDKSLGIINPSLVSFGINTMAPILAHRYFPKNIANLDRDIVFGKNDTFISDKENHNKGSRMLNSFNIDDNSLISKYIFNPINRYITKPAKDYFINPVGKYAFSPMAKGIGVGLEFGLNNDSRYYVGQRDATKISDAQFIENRILGYLSVSMGYFFGKKAAFKMRKKFEPLISSLLFKTINMFGFIDFESAVNDLNPKDIVGLSNNDKKFLILRSILKENIPIVFMLKNTPKFSELQKMFFDSLIISKSFSEEELAKFELDSLNGQISEDRLNKLVDTIISNISGMIVQKIGGIIGAITSRTIIDHIVQKNYNGNTYYKRLQNQISPTIN